MTNEEKIIRMSRWELAKFLFDVSEGEAEMTNCEKECESCEMSDAWCISEIAEWLKGEANDN